MTPTRAQTIKVAATVFLTGWTIRNIIGAIAAAPILYGLAQQSALMAAIVIVSCVGGLALNIALPAWAWRKISRRYA